MLVVGDQEQATGTATPRRRHGAGGEEAVAVDELVAELVRDVKERRHGRPERDVKERRHGRPERDVKERRHGRPEREE
jgi:hypothetical protein